MLAAISNERGVESVMISTRSINCVKFKMFLDAVREQHPYDQILFVMDNLSVHKNKKVLERMDELGFRWAYTPRYSPAFNPIEETFAEVKHYIKKKRLNAI